MTLAVNKTYKGSIRINEYGEIYARPFQKGSENGNLRTVNREGQVTILQSAHMWRLQINFRKDEVNSDLIAQVMDEAHMMAERYMVVD